MQEHLREIEGTLARTNERKSTLLYKLAKRKAEEERLSKLGVRSIPSNPLEVEDVNVVKYVLFKLKQEIGDKIAKLRNPHLLNVETHGEVVIRAKNDEVNHLITKKNLWERRLAVLSGKSYKTPPSKKLYFGCAKNLSEVQHELNQEENDNMEDKIDNLESESPITESSDDESDIYPSDVYLKQLASYESEDVLRSIEMIAEQKLRLDKSQEGVGLALKRSREGSTNYIIDINLPSEEEFRKNTFDSKKEFLKKRIDSLKK